MSRRVMTGVVLLLVALSAPASYAAAYGCWNQQSNGCWFYASWDSVGDRTYWNYSCEDDETFVSGSLSGDQTGTLC